jgi:hypothetical protein
MLDLTRDDRRCAADTQEMLLLQPRRSLADIGKWVDRTGMILKAGSREVSGLPT